MSLIFKDAALVPTRWVRKDTLLLAECSVAEMPALLEFGPANGQAHDSTQGIGLSNPASPTLSWVGRAVESERVFSRVKGQRFLNRITIRRLMKVAAHCYLALIAMQSVVCV